jgi:glycosyltransferase involved in cell wall biosynthesis
MADADALVLSSVEEGSAMVTYEARGAGCVLLVSDCSGAICTHGVDALIHQAGDVAALTAHIALLDGDRALLARLREASLAGRDGLSWDAAGRRLLEVYREALAVPSA